MGESSCARASMIYSERGREGEGENECMQADSSVTENAFNQFSPPHNNVMHVACRGYNSQEVHLLPSRGLEEITKRFM